MYKASPQRARALFFLVACAVTALALAQTPAPAVDAARPAAAPIADGLQITELAEDPNKDPINGKRSHIGLNTKLWVVLSQVPPGDVAQYTLFLNDEQIKGLDAPIATTFRSQPALLFKLKRTPSNDSYWRELLGAPRASHLGVTVSLGRQAGAEKSDRISGTPDNSQFEFQVFSGFGLTLTGGMILLVLILVWGSARNRTTLRDNLLPQLEPSRQTFSLARSQMAFWFTLIFVAFVALFILLQDTNTLNSQALSLMGISGVTALAAVAVDVKRNSPADDANRALQALGLKTFDDVKRVRQEVADREAELAGLVPPPTVTSLPEGFPEHNRHAERPEPTAGEKRRVQLQIEINDRNSILRTYDDKTLPFISQGWYKDVTTDINGPTVHRVQVVLWTGTLGAIFLYSVYHNLAMPEFNGTLLTLMGLSGAGYVGFKFQEVNN
jgi:hypothetical protein